MPESPPDVRDLLNAQTGRISWTELQRHFARGVVLAVAPGLDLVEVAASVVEDDTPRFRAWLDAGAVTRASLQDAQRWETAQTRFWAVVAAPWVLVQEDRSTG
jgi:hypothetical protein